MVIREAKLTRVRKVVSSSCTTIRGPGDNYRMIDRDEDLEMNTHL